MRDNDQSVSARPAEGIRSLLAHVEGELALTREQRTAWRALVGVAEEVNDAISAVDQTAASCSADHVPGLTDALEVTCHRLAVRLAAACRIASAATVLRDTLTPRQRARADRLLALLSKELSLPAGEPPVPSVSGAIRRIGAGRSAPHARQIGTAHL